MSWDRATAPTAAPSTPAAPGAPLQAVLPAICWAAIVDTVAAAMWPVLPRATPATSERCVRRRNRSRTEGGRSRAGAVTRGGYGGPPTSEAVRSQTESQDLRRGAPIRRPDPTRPDRDRRP